MLKIILIVILAGLLLVAALPLLLGPILVRFTLRLSANPDLARIDSDHLPPPVRSYFDAQTGPLQGLGFRIVADLVQTGFIPNLVSLIRLFVHPDNRDGAICVCMESGRGVRRLQAAYVEYATTFADGRELCTNNSPSPNAFAPVPEKQLHRLPAVEDPRELYEIHREAAAQFGGNTGRILLDGEEAIRTLNRSIQEDTARQIRTGYLYLDRASQCYRPTWKGAFLMTWKQVFKGAIGRKGVRKPA